ncbi:MAG TPA: HAMP domain-containing sensor histidine kinase [Burkholderiales bacterium]|jgi:signal transduction histidine kinase|nr:HAMP domain-containing sensor histidine kinase [Burkholderiales bacterium]
MRRAGFCAPREDEALPKRWHRHGLAKRLYLRIYLALIASLLLLALLFGLMMRWSFSGNDTASRLEAVAEAAAGLLPPATAPRDVQLQSLQHWHARAGLDLALFGADGAGIAYAGAAQDAPAFAPASHWLHGHPPGVALKLPDGRWLSARAPGSQGFGALQVFGSLALVALAVGMAAFPVARRLTRRLERLQHGVEALGEGDLSARVPVQGHDEIARLARSFNGAAEYIEALVAAQKSLLANASHELRSPLARIRMAAELHNEGADTQGRRELARNIAELDQLIDEILLASRLDAARSAEEHFEAVDLTALAAEECARAEVEFDSDGLISVQGEARLLRRMIRNLIENARRYGGASPVEVSLRRGGNGVVLEVADRGPGVSTDERERIFEPFYRARGASEGQGGVGLGLSLVRQIAARHGADAQCLAREGGGSVFRVEGLA